MTLIRQICLLLLLSLLLAFGGSAAVFLGSARSLLENELAWRNRDAAAVLAQELGLQEGLDAASVGRALAARFDGGRYRRVRYLPTAGPGGPVQLEAGPEAHRAPDWFVALVPIDAEAGTAPVVHGAETLGTLEVLGRTGAAHDELWRGCLQGAVVVGLLGLAVGAMAAVGLGSIRRRLGATVAQAAALERGDYLTLPEPVAPELQQLTRAMNSMVGRLRSVFEAQATQVEALRRQANCDPLTGLSNRGHFIAQLGAALSREDAIAAGGMVLLRVLRLVEMNRSIGRDSVDQLLTAIAQTLQAYASQVRGAFVGRLNGADFALVLPEGGIATESAEALVNLLQARLPIFHPQGAVVAGAVEVLPDSRVAQLLADADMALAQAETEGPFRVMSAGAPGNEAWAGMGERGWHERVRSALVAGRVRLGSYPLVDANGGLVHFECPLRLQLTEEGPYESAASWLPFATRSRLNSAIDERGLALALEATLLDGLPRCINIASASLLDSGFAGRLRGRLLRAPPAAARAMWLEVMEPADDEQFELMRELSRQIRPTGARFGIEHAGARPGRTERLFEAGVDYVKLDAAITRGVAGDADRAQVADGLVAMLHGLSLQVFGEGVVDAADAARLWQSGIDGLTGPGVDAPARPPIAAAALTGSGQDGADRNGPSGEVLERDVLERDGPERAGPERAGPARAGPERDDPDRQSPDRRGPNRRGPYREGPDSEGPDRDGSDRDSPDGEAPNRTT